MKVGDTVWSVKYWATMGVRPMSVGRVYDNGKYVGVGVEARPGATVWVQRVGVEVFPTRAEAVAQAEKLRAKKLASLARQVAKIQALDFTKG